MKRSVRRIFPLLAIFGLLACDSEGDKKDDAKPKEEASAKADDKEDDKADEAKADDAKADDAKADDAKADDAKADDAKADDAKAEGGEAAAEGGEPAAEGGEEEGGDEPAADEAKALENAAVFVVRDKGVVVLTDDGFATLPGSAGVFLQKTARSPDGKLYALSTNAIFQIHADKLARVADAAYDEVGTISVFDVAEDGTFWAAGSKGVSSYKDGKWTTEKLIDAGITETFFTGLALDGDGQPWVATSKKLAHRVDGGWTPVEMGGKKTVYYRSVASGPEGAVFLVSMDKLYRLNPTAEVVKVKKPRFSSLGDLAFSQSGIGVVETSTESVAVFMPDDKVAQYKTGKDYKVGMHSAVGVDDQGRVWIAGDSGVAILGPGDERVAWRSGSIEEIAGQISRMSLIGNGPKLPEAGEVKKGGLKGKVLKGGEGVAKAKIELCESPSMIYSKTPCTDAPTHLQGETDDEGGFEFSDVPLGAYGVAVKVGKKWQITLGAALGSKMKEGEAYDIGSIEIKDE